MGITAYVLFGGGWHTEQKIVRKSQFSIEDTKNGGDPAFKGRIRHFVGMSENWRKVSLASVIFTISPPSQYGICYFYH
jgi:hypothetical protein